MITICFTYFKSLTLANLEAALYTVYKQSFLKVREIVIFDNDTPDGTPDIWNVVRSFDWPVQVRVLASKHGDKTRAQAWSTNRTVEEAKGEWVFYTRADYLLAFDMLEKFQMVLDAHPKDWDGFVVSHGRHLGNSIGEIDQHMPMWRDVGPKVLGGIDYDYTEIDSGVWMMRAGTYARVGGFDERLSAWGHAQTEFQHRVWEAGVEFARIRETLFFHPGHGGEKDIDLAHKQLEQTGKDIRKLWERYDGPKFY